ncbi:MAG: penicillin-binding protein 2 [Rhodobacteraceae bacterium]|nr:penicillin-binding protein 2 [Paracoccaceae bacterium]MCY4137782.1 penicillin-binding protein 2 [Paracoccaceae bacterium]
MKLVPTSDVARTTGELAGSEHREPADAAGNAGTAGGGRARELAERRSNRRLTFLLAFLSLCFCVLAVQMTLMTNRQPDESERYGLPAGETRAEIHDRNGNLLAVNVKATTLAAVPADLANRGGTVRALSRIFPDLDADGLLSDFNSKRKFVWVRKELSPEQHQAVHDIGEPGLVFGERLIRFYPNGRLAAHVLGGVRNGREGLGGVELVGVGGVEGYFDNELRRSARSNRPLALSIDLSVQAAARQVLAGGLELVNSKKGSAVLMDVHSGEVLAMVSLPDFDPNSRPPLPRVTDPADSPLFNHAVQGIYELGSAQKVLTVAMGLESGRVGPSTMVNTTQPLVVGGNSVSDFKYKGPTMSVRDIIIESSNVGVARIALCLGRSKQKEFLSSLGYLDPVKIELTEAAGAKPIVPRVWRKSTTVTVSYGHGLSVSPLRLATSYAAIANGGVLVNPTLRKNDGPVAGKRVISAENSNILREFLRGVVMQGTATIAQKNPYQIGGKTGTADKVAPNGRYYEDRVVSTFAAMFPVYRPKYVLVVIVDEPEIEIDGKNRRTAGWTAVPIASSIIFRVAPLLGLKPADYPDSWTIRESGPPSLGPCMAGLGVGDESRRQPA